jgi:hypothetical protein
MNQPPLVSIAHFSKSRLGIAPMKKTARIASEVMQIPTVNRKLASTPM